MRNDLEASNGSRVSENPQTTSDKAAFASTKGHSLLTWDDLSVSIRGKTILSHLTGSLTGGEIMGVLGPSGAGKSTLLDAFASHTSLSAGSITLDGVDIKSLPSGTVAYVEQHDALLGVLTVRETISYSARLCNPTASRHQINSMVDHTIRILGLTSVESQRIGTPISRGISGGQKRRVTIGCALVSQPRVLLLDEPTSGLDSFSGREVVKALKSVARSTGIPVICTIHQPNWETFSMFDVVLVLSAGRTVYRGSTDNLAPYMESEMEIPLQEHVNPADVIIEAINYDFGSSVEKDERPFKSTDHYSNIWETRQHNTMPLRANSGINESVAPEAHAGPSLSGHVFVKTLILMERATLYYRRNLLGYGVRLGMYLGMGILLATIWVKLGNSSTKINDRLSVHFFSVAFLGFMSVAGIPAFLEERHVFLRERMNGYYSPLPYVLANSIVTIPFLAACCLLFSVVAYWSIGLHPGAAHFFKFFIELFLAIYVAESQSVLVAAIMPIFVAALAIASFLNGFWMCVQGYFIRAVNLPRFWYWWAHWIDYQTFAFNFLVNNDFRGLEFPCPSVGSTCQCPYPSSLDLAQQCALRGEDVLDALDIRGISLGLYAGLLVVIALVFRVLLWVALMVRKK